MKQHDFIIGPTDTDSISFTKSDMSVMSKEEIDLYIKEINDLSPDFMDWADDGYYQTVIAVRAKNYALWDGKKLVTKGSSLKATVKSPAMKEFIQAIIWSIIKEEYNYAEIYNKYIKEIMNITDIKRFAVRKTITDKVLDGARTAEQKILTAIEDSEESYSEGDKAYVYYRPDNSLALVDKFDGNYNQLKLLKNLYDTAMCFQTIIDKNIFMNYSLKRNQKALQDLINGV